MSNRYGAARTSKDERRVAIRLTYFKCGKIPLEGIKLGVCVRTLCPIAQNQMIKIYCYSS